MHDIFAIAVLCLYNKVIESHFFTSNNLFYYIMSSNDANPNCGPGAEVNDKKSWTDSSDPTPNVLPENQQKPVPVYPPTMPLAKNKGGDVRRMIGNTTVDKDAVGLPKVKETWMKMKGLALPVLSKLAMALPIESLKTILPNLVTLVEDVLPGIIADRHDSHQMLIDFFANYDEFQSKLTDPLSTIAFNALEDLIKEATSFKQDPSNDSGLRTYMDHVERTAKDLHRCLSKYVMSNPKIKKLRVNVVPQRPLVPSDEKQWGIDVFFGCLKKLGYGFESSRQDAEQMAAIVQGGWTCDRDIIDTPTSCLYSLCSLKNYIGTNREVLSESSLKICDKITSDVLEFISEILPHSSYGDDTVLAQHWSGNVTPLSPPRLARSWTPPDNGCHNMEMEVGETGGAFSKRGLETDVVSDSDTESCCSNDSDDDAPVGCEGDDLPPIESMEVVTDAPSSEQQKRSLGHGPFSELWSSIVSCVTKWFFETNDSVSGVLTTEVYNADEKVHYVRNANKFAVQLQELFANFEAAYKSHMSPKFAVSEFKTFVGMQKELLRKMVIPSSAEAHSNFGAYMSFLTCLGNKSSVIKEGYVVYGGKSIPLKKFIDLCDSIVKISADKSDDKVVPDSSADKVDTPILPDSKKRRMDTPVTPGSSRLKSFFECSKKHDKKHDKKHHHKKHDKKKSVTIADGPKGIIPTDEACQTAPKGIIPTELATPKAMDLAKRYNVTYI